MSGGGVVQVVVLGKRVPADVHERAAAVLGEVVSPLNRGGAAYPPTVKSYRDWVRPARVICTRCPLTTVGRSPCLVAGTVGGLIPLGTWMMA